MCAKGILLGLLLLPWPRALSAGEIQYSRDIQPILSQNCFQCHGPDPGTRKGGTDGLRLDTAAGATADLGAGDAAIVPGHPEKSELVARITSQDPDEAMPLKESGKKLSQREIGLLTQWIKEGAKYAPHWSYVKPVRPPLPNVADKAWPRNEIDNFILARLEKEGLKPSPEADRYTLVRRVSIDLTGLPPTPAEVEQFVGDQSPKAYENLVDRLLKKPAYGERWAQMWLDLARYADSAGFASDPLRNIWLYRDYVIRSLNADKPFDQFTIEQIAGDLLPHPTEEQLIATGFHRNTMTNTEGGTTREEFRNMAIVDRVNTTMQVWMATTINCAQCHSHKFDPITNEEFFRLFAIFNNTEDADRPDEAPLVSEYTEEQQRERSRYGQEIARLQESLKRPTPELAAAQAKWEQAFPHDLAWKRLKTVAVKTKVSPGVNTDTYQVEAPLAGSTIRALRLEAPADDSLAGDGAAPSKKHVGKGFGVTRVAATLASSERSAIRGQFVRVELPGPGKRLSLAEVQVFRGAENVALRGEAKQISTDFGGEARLAIDGNTDGSFFTAKSTTHTALSDNPWWEVDLKAELDLDRLVVWNRTDGDVGSRLSNFRVLVLDGQRRPVWEQFVAASPMPSVELSLSGRRTVEFAAVGQIDEPRVVTLLTKEPISVPSNFALTLTIEQDPKLAERTQEHFSISTTDDARVAQWLATPASVRAALQVPAAKRSASQQAVVTQYFLSIAPELDTSRKQLAEATKLLSEIKATTSPVMRELPADKHRVTKMQHRGNYLDVGKEVEPGTPAAFPPLPKGARADRLALARWLVDENNPLTPRVLANRYWEQIFGIGIVATSEDFGSQGDRPVHPELLDWLATELIRTKWDMKELVRLLVTSAAYRQSSRVSPELEQRDPDNRLLARGPRFRLSAEEVRDQALVVSGLFSAKMYGPPTRPAQPSSGLNAAFGGGIDWQTSAGEDKYRRGVYTTWRRSNLYPSMATFDAPTREVCALRRVRTNTPLQALVTLNDPVYIEAAQALARRIIAEGGSTPADRIGFGIRLCLARPPHDGEVGRIVQLYDQALARFRTNADAARRMATEPLGPAPKGADMAELAAWTVVGNVLLNLDETLMKR